MTRQFSMVWGDAAGIRFHVTGWGEDGAKPVVVFNLADSTGDHTLTSARFRKLAAEVQQAIKAARGEVLANMKKQAANQAKSAAAISARWREDMVRYEADKDPWILAERTLAGTNYVQAKDCAESDTFEAGQSSKCTGGHAYDTRLSCYYGRLIDGGFVLDIHDALDQHPSKSYASPMLDSFLTEPSRFADSSAKDSWLLNVFADDPLNGFCGLARLAKMAGKVPEFSGFDYVPLSLFLAWWRERGGRVGQRQGNRIVWEDGATEDIRPEANRWQDVKAA